MLGVDTEIKTLPKSQWIGPADVTRQPKKYDPDKKKTNLVCLITTCITDSFPELINCSEGKFIRFQDRLKAIISEELKND